MKEIKWGKLAGAAALVLGGLFLGKKAFEKKAEQPETIGELPEGCEDEYVTYDDSETTSEE